MADNRSRLETAIQAGIDTALKEVHTCLPGEIISFDPATQLANIQLLIKRKQSGKLVNIAVLQDVPIRYMASKKFSMTFPLEEGDEVEVKFAERSIDVWLENGGIQNPDDRRKHSFSDAYATPMLYSQQKKIENFDPDNLQIRTADGLSLITLTAAGEIQLNGDTNSIVKYAALNTALQTMLAAFNVDIAAAGGAGNTTLDISAAEVLTVKVP